MNNFSKLIISTVCFTSIFAYDSTATASTDALNPKILYDSTATASTDALKAPASFKVDEAEDRYTECESEIEEGVGFVDDTSVDDGPKESPIMKENAVNRPPTAFPSFPLIGFRDTFLTPAFILCLASKEKDSIVNLVGQIGNNVQNPLKITDIYLCVNASTSKVLEIIKASDNLYKNIMIESIAKFCADNNINYNDENTFWAIDTCNTISELYNVVIGNAPSIRIRPLEEILLTPGNYYYRNLKNRVIEKINNTNVLTTFSENVETETSEFLETIAKTMSLVGKVIKDKNIKAMLENILNDSKEEAIVHKNHLITCRQLTKYLQEKGIIGRSVNISNIYPERMVSTANPLNDILNGIAEPEHLLARTKSTSLLGNFIEALTSCFTC